MNNKLLLLTGVAAGAVTSSCAEAPKEQSAPNIVIIYADDVGYGDLECYGGEVPTPNINKLASGGVRFTNAHTTSATSTPSRFGLLTGIYPWRVQGTGIAAGDAGMIIAPERYTLADAAKSAGYRTGAIGKWHLGLGVTAQQDWNGEVSPNLSDIGFDYSYIMAATGDRVPCVFIENGRVDNYDPSAPIYVSYSENFEGEPTGRSNPEMLKVHPSHGHDQSIVNGISRIGYMKGGGKALWVDEDIADQIAQRAAQFIEQSADSPFMLYFGTHDIHVPRVPHPRFAGKSGMGPRGDAILQFDFQVGEVMDALHRAGVADNTIIILSSDNGPVVDDGYEDQAVELLGTHRPAGDLRGGKYSAFEAGTRVPMIVSWPESMPKGVVSSALFSQIDMLASLSSLMGVELPEKSDSRNSLEFLLGESTEPGRDYIVEQNIGGTLSLLTDDGFKYISPSKGARYNPYTDIEMGNDPEGQLYNLNDDIGEQTNLIDSLPDMAEQLRQTLAAERAKSLE